MRTFEQIEKDLDILRRTHASQYGKIYDDGSLESLMFSMAREKMMTSMRSTLQSYNAAELVLALALLRDDLKAQRKGTKK